jgi:hypothetical protein
MKAIGRRGEGWDKGEGEGQGRREVHSPAFSNTPQFEPSESKPGVEGL